MPCDCRASCEVCVLAFTLWMPMAIVFTLQCSVVSFHVHQLIVGSIYDCASTLVSTSTVSTTFNCCNGSCNKAFVTSSIKNKIVCCLIYFFGHFFPLSPYLTQGEYTLFSIISRIFLISFSCNSKFVLLFV